MQSTPRGFSHGTDFGYRNGCRTQAACPATPTCSDAHDERLERRRTQVSDAPGEGKTIWVERRVRQTLDVVGPTELRDYAGVTNVELERVLSKVSVTVSHDLAERLDAAWSWFVRGVDVRAPGFEHGTASAYQRSCRCRHCGEAVAKDRDRHRRGIRHPSSGVSPATMRKVMRHLDTLREHGSIVQIARAAGVAKTPVYRATRGKVVNAVSARKLLETTPAMVRDAVADATLVPAAESEHYVRTMWALGYPFTWIAEQIGEKRQEVARINRPRTYITVRRARLIADLAARVGDRQPGPDDDIDPIQVRRAQRAARKAGWYPPAAYDDDRRLDVRAIPGNPFEKADRWAERRLHVTYLLALGHTSIEAARLANVDRATIQNRLPHGLTYRGKGLGLDLEKSAERIRQIVAAYELVESAECGPVTAAMTLGIQPGDYRIKRGWKDHPEVLAWEAAHATETPGNTGQTVDSTHFQAA